jgi:hypothetical protein
VSPINLGSVEPENEPPRSIERPIIDTTEQDGLRLLTETMTALHLRNARPDGPVLFTTGDALSQIVQLDNDNRAQLQSINSRGAMFRTLVESAQFVRRDRRRTEVVYHDVFPPREVLDAVIARERAFPACLRVVHVPVFAPDGTLCLAPGYHADARIVHKPLPGFVLPPLSRNPSDDEIALAAATLWKPFQEFPFETDADRIHMIALVLGPFIRELIDGPTPLMLIEKPDAGSGAGLLVDLVSSITLGMWAPLTPVPKAREEWGKTLTSAILKGTPLIVLDNLPIGHMLDADELAVAITASYWDARILGANRMPSLPIRTTWAATATNPTLSRELLRRSVRIRIVPCAERPWLRENNSFAIRDLREWIVANRPQVVHAAISLVQA